MLRHDMLMLGSKLAQDLVQTVHSSESDVLPLVYNTHFPLSPQPCCSSLSCVSATHLLRGPNHYLARIGVVSGCIVPQASPPKQARTMAASQEPPWHGMKGMTRITSEFKVDAAVGNNPTCCQEARQSILYHMPYFSGHQLRELPTAVFGVVVARQHACSCSTSITRSGAESGPKSKILQLSGMI